MKWFRNVSCRDATRIITAFVVGSIILGIGSLSMKWNGPEDIIQNWEWVFIAVVDVFGVFIGEVTGVFFSKNASDKPIFSTIVPPENNNTAWEDYREGLIKRVRTLSIDSYEAQQAKFRHVYIDLNMEYAWDAVQRSNLHYVSENTPVPPEKTIRRVFEDSGRSLLILGEPASGKTFTLIQLHTELLDIAEKTAEAPVPLMFNLSSWEQKYKSLADWFIEQCGFVYGVHKQMAKELIAEHKLIYLLDGLDENKYQDQCLQAINQFIEESRFKGIVVCSRIEDYKKLKEKLKIANALQIKPLTLPQINAILSKRGRNVLGLKKALQQNMELDKDLKKMLESPLFLNLLIITYENKIPELKGASFEEKLVHLFNSYVTRMFIHKELKNVPYTQEQALHWVTNLAYGLYKTNQSVFYIEYLQPVWLPHNKAKKIASFIFWGLFSMLVIIPTFGNDGPGAINMLIFIIVLLPVLLIGLIYGVVRIPNIPLYATRSFFIPTKYILWTNITKLFRGRLLRGLLSDMGRIVVQVSMLIGGLSGGLIGLLSSGLISRLISGLISGLIWGLIFGLVAVLNLGVMYLLIGMMIGLVFSFWRFADEPISRHIPNKGIWQILKQGLISGLILGLIFGPILGLILGLIFGPILGLIFGLIFEPTNMRSIILDDMQSLGTSIWLLSGLIFVALLGVINFFHHYILRFTLSYYNVLPHYGSDKKLIAFLDAMAERLLLRRVGGGWVFIHDYLLKYFARRHPDFKPREGETENSSNQS